MVYRLEISRKILQNPYRYVNKLPFCLKISVNTDELSGFSLEEFKNYRQQLWRFIYALRRRKIFIDLSELRLQSIKHDVLLIGPETLQVNIVDRCNYRCNFCLSHSQFRGSEFSRHRRWAVPFSTVKRIVDQAFILGVNNIFLCGEGEPLLHPRIYDIISYIGNKGFKIELITNASIFYLAHWLEKNMPLPFELSFLINLSGVNPEKFSLIHGVEPDKFKELLITIKKLSRNAFVVLSYLLLRDNIGDVKEYIQLASRLGVARVKLRYPVLYEEEHKKILPSKKDEDEFMRLLPSLREYASRYGVDLDMSDFIRNDISKMDAPFRCYSGWFFAKVGMDGKMYMCCRENKPLGVIKDGNWGKIYFSSYATERILEGKRGINLNSVEWGKCKYCFKYEHNNYIDKLVVKC